MKIAMWSGPRNLSTAMMYAFAARGDCAVVDEPFYASYLSLTNADHPMRRETLASQSNDPVDVARGLVGTPPGQKEHFYQKHMTHHMVSGVPCDWISQVVNVFLIRHPARVIASYAQKRQNPNFDDLGFHQQEEIFDLVRETLGTAIVVDSHDIRANPAKSLHTLCQSIGIAYTDAMLSWPSGGIAEDGAWAPHWYGAIHNSTGFAGPEGPLPDVPETLRSLLDRALPCYERMKAFCQLSN